MELTGRAFEFLAVRCDQVDFQIHQVSPFHICNRDPRHRDDFPSGFVSCNTGCRRVSLPVSPMPCTAESAEARTQVVTDAEINQSRAPAGS
jgi:hypothetical protein